MIKVFINVCVPTPCLHVVYIRIQTGIVSAVRGDCCPNMLDPSVETIILCWLVRQVACVNAFQSHIWGIDPIITQLQSHDYLGCF